MFWPHTAEMQRVGILCGANKRAAIACARGLASEGVKTLLLFREKGDIRSRIAMRRYARLGERALFRNDSEDIFIASLKTISRIHGAFTLLPIGEQYTRWMARNKEELERSGVYPAVCDYATYCRLSDKASFMEMCKRFGLDIPERYDQKALSQDIMPFVVRPRVFLDDTGILKYPVLVATQGAYRRIIAMRLDLEGHIIERMIPGPGIYFCGCYQNGELLQSFTQITLLQQPGGMSVLKAAPSAQLPDTVTDNINNMFSSLEYSGVMMMELKKCPQKNRFYAIECNPRMWGPLQLCIDHGVNFPAMLAGASPADGPKRTGIGYTWNNGILDGYLKKLRFRSGFQRTDSMTGIAYKDVWYRSDTLPYAILEPFFLMASLFFGKRGAGKGSQDSHFITSEKETQSAKPSSLQ